MSRSSSDAQVDLTMSPSPRSPGDEERRKLLATWPRSGEAQDYARLLADELLYYRGHRRLLIETSVLCYAIPSPREDRIIPHHVARAQLWMDRNCVHGAEAIASGPNPYTAKANAELYALRASALGRVDMPVLGRLFTRDPLTVDLEQIGGRYKAIFRFTSDQAAWYRDCTLSKDTYVVPAYVSTFDEEHGTWYMRLKNIDDDLRALLGRFMTVGQTIYLHRVLLALSSRYISDLENLAATRLALGLPEFKGKLREGHHVDGFGLNNRESNLRPLEPYVHSAYHSGEGGFERFVFGANHPGPLDPILWLPSPTLVTPSGVLGQAGHDALWRQLEESGDAPEAYQVPPDHGHPPRPITRREVACLGPEQTLLTTLKALSEAGGQGMLRILKNTDAGASMATSTLREALERLVDHGIVGKVDLGGGVSEQARALRGVEKHFRLLRPLSRRIFSGT